MGHNRLDVLSARQLECIRLAARFQTSDEIAYRLGISPKTVDSHIANTVEKLGVNSRRDAILLLLELDDSPRGKPLSEFPRVAPIGPIDAPPVSEPETNSRLRDVSDADPKILLIDSSSMTETRGGGLEIHDLTPLQRVAIIIAIAVAITVFLIAIPPMAAGFGALANFIEPYRR